MASSTAVDGVEGKDYLKQPGFTKTFTLPATADHEALNVSYADVGAQPSPSGGKEGQPPVVLFMPGMFATRYIGVVFDLVGKKQGVRILTVDRPGMGFSTEVPLEKRIAIWVELVPKLLVHLEIPHVSLVSHSAGTLFLLNTLYSCRQILSPTRPYAALIAPFVDVQHSGIKMLQAAQFLPNMLFGSLDTTLKAINSNIAPVIGSSLSFMSSWLPQTTPTAPKMTDNRLRWQRDYGYSLEYINDVMDSIHTRMAEESTAGANDEARLCLKKGGDNTWGECEDFDIYVKKLLTREKLREGEPKLNVRIIFAREDNMIGKAGQEYMEKCWAQDSELMDAIIYKATTFDADHDSLMTKAEVLEEVVTHVLGADGNGQS